jgi:hypothetical protein
VERVLLTLVKVVLRFVPTVRSTKTDSASSSLRLAYDTDDIQFLDAVIEAGHRALIDGHLAQDGARSKKGQGSAFPFEVRPSVLDLTCRKIG